MAAFRLSILYVTSILVLLFSLARSVFPIHRISGCAQNVRDIRGRKILAGTTADEAERGRFTLSSVPLFTFGHRFHFLGW